MKYTNDLIWILTSFEGVSLMEYF